MKILKKIYGSLRRTRKVFNNSNGNNVFLGFEFCILLLCRCFGFGISYCSTFPPLQLLFNILKLYKTSNLIYMYHPKLTICKKIYGIEQIN